MNWCLVKTSVVLVHLLHLLSLSRTWDHVARNSNTTLEDICTKQPDIQQDTDATKAFYSLLVILFVCDMMLDGIYKVSGILFS